MNITKNNSTAVVVAGLAAIAVSIFLILKSGNTETGNSPSGTVLLQPGQSEKIDDVEAFANLDQDALKRHGFGYVPVSHTYPSRDVEQQALLSEIGIRRSFEEIAGIPLPGHLKPRFGEYSVSKYHSMSTNNFNAWVALYFKAEPSKVLALVDQLEALWKERIGDVPIYTHRSHPEGGVRKEFQFTKGSVLVIVREKKSRRLEHFYKVRGDPTTGLIEITNFRGDNE